MISRPLHRTRTKIYQGRVTHFRKVMGNQGRSNRNSWDSHCILHCEARKTHDDSRQVLVHNRAVSERVRGLAFKVRWTVSVHVSRFPDKEEAVVPIQA